MLTTELLLLESSVFGFTVYGIALLWLKALLILVTTQTLADQFELSSATVRHTIWLLAFVCLAALPVLTIVLPTWYALTIELLPTPINPSSDFSYPSLITEPATSWPSLFDGLLFIYLVVVSARFIYLIGNIFRIAWLTSTAKPVDDSWYTLARKLTPKSISIKYCEQLAGPVTWGTLTPVILLPLSSRSWSSAEQEMVLNHEIGHILRWDWLTQLLSHCIAILYWPVPGIRKAHKALSLESECACDNWVLSKGTDPADYAALLVQQAKLISLPATVALGSASELSQRVKHIVSVYVDRTGERVVRCGITLIALAALFPLATFKANGSWIAENPLSGMTLIPIYKAASPDNPAPRKKALPIDAPNKPLEVISPPHTDLYDSGHVITENHYLQSDNSPLETYSPQVQPLNPQQPYLLALLEKRAPVYPRSAMRRGIEGSVVVEFDINHQGQAINPVIISAEPSTVFNDAVTEAIQGYRFHPDSLKDKSLPIKGMRKKFTFSLNDSPRQIPVHNTVDPPLNLNPG